MLLTTELRWFYDGILPTSIREWFGQAALGRGLEAPQARKDRYLLVPNCDYLNVKLREGSLEVKLRQESLGAFQVKPRWVGQIERWMKWSCDDAAIASPVSQRFSSDGQWMDVYKARQQCHYQLNADQSFQALSVDQLAEQSIRQGCSIELTQLKTDRHEAWSIAFEAFGEGDRQLEVLHRLAEQVADMPHSPALSLDHSFAYPHWLKTSQS